MRGFKATDRTSLFNLNERNANDACQRERERQLERKKKRMKCEDDMLKLVARVKGHCLTKKGLKKIHYVLRKGLAS